MDYEIYGFLSAVAIQYRYINFQSIKKNLYSNKKILSLPTPLKYLNRSVFLHTLLNIWLNSSPLWTGVHLHCAKLCCSIAGIISFYFKLISQDNWKKSNDSCVIFISGGGELRKQNITDEQTYYFNLGSRIPQT